MPYNILHVTPYMHASAGGPPVVVENFIAEANRLGHSSEIVSTFAFCNGDDSNLRKRLEQLAPTTFLTGLETVPVVSRSGAEKINAHVRRADIVHVHTLWSPLNVAARLCVSEARQTLRAHAPWHARSLLIVPQSAEEIRVFEVFRGA